MDRISVPKKGVLGRGLSALLADDDEMAQQKAAITAAISSSQSIEEEGGVRTVMLSLADLSPGRFQPRSYFDEEKLRELTDSIKENGVLQPILVRSDVQAGKYQIIAGERRWRASRQAGLEKIPAIIKELPDKIALEVALIENIQRQSLTPIEEAEGYKKLMEEFSHTQEQLASGLGKSRSHITNMMRLLQLPEEVKDMINTGSITMGHARALIKATNPTEIAYEIVNKGLSVRDAEKFAAGSGKTVRTSKGTSSIGKNKAYQPDDQSGKDDDLLALEQVLSKSMGLKVTVEDSSDGGKVTLYFNNLAQLDTILQKLG